MARFVIRNYGHSRQFHPKGGLVTLSRDQAIETDDLELANALGAEEKVNVTDRGIEAAAPIPIEEPKKKKERKVTVDEEPIPKEDSEGQETPEVKSEDVDSEEIEKEIAYDDMTVKELQELAKDRQLTTSGLRKAELIEALEDYDAGY